ncbi:MAG: hypothetical protein KDE26_27785 [Bacteroidetes bacterium]|nr:hypothetical protein [Bacteroidota bacterium]
MKIAPFGQDALSGKKFVCQNGNIRSQSDRHPESRRVRDLPGLAKQVFNINFA